jgi:membrane protein YqaA with SNARE-associated domain
VLTYAIGVKIGDTGLVRFVPEHRLDRLRKRVKDIGAVAMGVSAGLPPPFPMTAFVLTCGALKVNRVRFLTVVAIARLIRFGAEAALASRYGPSVVRLLESDTAQRVIIGLVVVSIAGTTLTIVRVWRSTRRQS